MEGEDPEVDMPRAIGGRGKTGKTEEKRSLAFEEEENARLAVASDMPPLASAVGTTSATSMVDTFPSTTAGDTSRSLFAKKVWQRMLIMVAGALMNLVLGFVLLVVMFGFCVTPNANGDYLLGTTMVVLRDEAGNDYAADLSTDDPVFDQEATPQSVRAGLRDEDVILRVDGKRMVTYMDINFTIANKKSGHFDLVVKRGSERVTLKNVPIAASELRIYGKERTFFNVFTEAAKTEYSVGVLIWRTLGNIVTGKMGPNELAGPVGTITLIGNQVQQVTAQPDMRDGLYNLLMLVVMITVNVGIFNLLPFPGLDGGRMLFLVVEGVTRRKVPQKYEGYIHAAGLVLLMLLMVFVTFGDIRRLVMGG